MKKLLFAFLFLLVTTFATAKPAPVYEMRIYHCHDGRLDALLQRFQNHTLKLFEKHGMTNIGYWIPTDKTTDLIYVLAYPSMEAREASWKAFINDPEWQQVSQKSEEDGKIIASIESIFMKIEPELTKKIKLQAASPERLFEIRTYYCLPNRFPNIVARFRDHTRKLFEKHGMTNIAYWSTIEKDDSQSKLVYIVAHKDATAAKVSWDNFRNDPKWIAVRDASESSGKIVEKIVSIYMKPAAFSKIK